MQGNLSRGPKRVVGDGIRERLVNTLLICRGVHKKFMAGNQEPMLRHIKRSTGGRSQSGMTRILKCGGCTPTVSRGKLRARLYIFVSFRAIFCCSPDGITETGSTLQASKLNSPTRKRRKIRAQSFVQTSAENSNFIKFCISIEI